MRFLSHSRLKSLTFPLLLLLLLLLLFSFSSSSAQPLSPSQAKTLIRLQRILEYPSALSPFASQTNYGFCNLAPSPSLSISCSGDRVTALSISGDRRAPMSPAFSADALFTTLARLPSLTTLSLVSLGIWGAFPSKIDRFNSLQVLNLSSNYLYGAIPQEISKMTSLQNLVLANNSFNMTVPDLKPLINLTELDLSANGFGPDFPSLGKNLVRLVLKNNSFRSKIPDNIGSLDHLQVLDLSLNQLMGWIPPALFSLRSIKYLDLSQNRLTGQLPANLACSNSISFVDLSYNLLSGALPSCINSNSSSRVVIDSWNCLSSSDLRYQHSSGYCNQGALAAILPPPSERSGSKSNLSLILGIVGGIIGGVALLGLLIVLVLRNISAHHPESSLFAKPIARKPLGQVSSKTPAEKRHISQAVRIGALEVMPYRTFTMEELEEATNGFDPSNLIKDNAKGQQYKGWLQDGSMVIVKCMKLKQKYSSPSLIQYMDIVSKLRHRNLVSIIGHCIVTEQDNTNTTSNIFLVSEYIANGTLRSHLTEWRKREMLKWPQRMTAVIGVARGIKFLHTVSVPGIMRNDISIENVLLDQTLTAKISDYNLPALPNNKHNKGGSESPFNFMEENEFGSIRRLEQGEKEDIYQLGIILLEVITGKFAGSQSKLDAEIAQLRKSLSDVPEKLKSMADPAIKGTFAFDSLRTAVEITLNCVSKDPKERPSIDDVLWNLQYSVQVQDGWASSESLSIQY
ncbi:probable LRR receptor-like serine/threonine-protein kinase At1g14390 [Ananas comosus]|uniref:Probable LRR receptor-like serine/threonine-protein kinase At1g14390 n=1 Tax=Ananas comosus TaxID=4615 RepID=A0A6P5EX70_ANACO|nr:probable LRR receptor-like serine/threonine-protein kinase At1g14390 [Ananas comosus]